MTRLAAFTLVELLVVIAIIGVLVALLLPAVQAAREAARKTQCKNNLKQLLIGLHLFHDANQVFPAAQDNNKAGTRTLNHSWMTHILPYVEQVSLYDRYDFSKTWNWKGGLGNSNGAVTLTNAANLSVQLCPSSEHTVVGQGDYGAVQGVGNYNHNGVKITDGFKQDQGYAEGVMITVGPSYPENGRHSIRHITDGTQFTIMLGEDAGRMLEETNSAGTVIRDRDVYWAAGGNAYVHHGVINTSRPNELFSDHPGGVHIAMADTSVRWLSEFTSKRVVDFIGTRAREEVLNNDF